MVWVLRAALALLAVWGAVRAFGLEGGFPLVPLVAFTPYVLAVAVLLFAFTLFLRRWREAVAAGLLVMLFAAFVLPRAFPHQPTGPIADGVPLDVLSVNVRLGDADSETIVDLVRDGDVDLLSLQELTHEQVEPAARGGHRRAPARARAEPHPGR